MGTSIALFSITLFTGTFLYFSFNQYPIEREEIKKSLAFIQDHKNEGDKLMICEDAKSAFTYYTKTGQFNSQDLTVEYVVMGKEMKEFALKHSGNEGRYWFLFSHNLKKHQKEITGLIDFFRSNGYLIHLHQSTGSSVFLIYSR